MNIPKEESGVCDNVTLEEPDTPELYQPSVVKPTSVKMISSELSNKMVIEDKLIKLFSS